MNLSVVMLAYKYPYIELQCLRSILHNKSDFENLDIVVVANYANGKLTDFCGKQGITLIQNEENNGIPKSWNQGIEASKHELICITNSDVLFPTNSLRRMCEMMEKYPSVAFMGPTCHFENRRNTCDNQVKDIKPTVALGDLNESLFSKYGYGFRTGTGWISGYCFFIRKSIDLVIGGFDEQYGIGFYEEIDYQVTARQKGYLVGWCPGVYIHHVGDGRQTFLRMAVVDGFDINTQRKESSRKYSKKHGNDDFHEMSGERT